MPLKTLNDVFFSILESSNPQVMLSRKSIEWLPISSHELYRDVIGVARSLLSWGVQRGDRVAILSENRPEWTIADFACLLIGAIVVPIYGTLTGEQTAYMLRDADVRAIFVSNESQLQKIFSI